MLSRVKFMVKQSTMEAIYAKTVKEVAQGTMGGPFTHEELLSKHGKYYNLSQALV